LKSLYYDARSEKHGYMKITGGAHISDKFSLYVPIP